MGASIPTSEVASPCVRRCCLDDDDVCIGCGRALHEIVAWGTADDTTRREILERSSERIAQRARQPGTDRR
ncbi:MAG TPA: DUF1289 domain-containing protein [Gammaproteobacteria bacterium]|nr:DUF1289 domain-containing protein [Gammaproteobacteria bacterium]